MTLLALVGTETSDALYQKIHEAVYDAYYVHGPLLEGDLSEYASDVFRRIQPELAEYVRAGLYEGRRAS